MLEEEQQRIDFLIQRDGHEAACRWIAATLKIYREALANDHSHASYPEYRPRFEQAVREFEQWLNECEEA